MPRLLVSDTSVLIDLQRGGVIEAFFKLPYEIAVPDVLFEEELGGPDGVELMKLGLQVVSLDDAGASLAQEYRKQERKLSTPDAFALALAKVGDHVLLAGDGSLRELATSDGVEVHGTLWVFDQFSDLEIVGPPELLKGLGAIAANRRCRLPRAEVQKRLKHYRGEE